MCFSGRGYEGGKGAHLVECDVYQNLCYAMLNQITILNTLIRPFPDIKSRPVYNGHATL